MSKPKDNKKAKKKNVQVAIRIRPMNEIEKFEKGRSIANCDRVTKMISMNTPKEQKQFGNFDYVYGPEASQTDLYMDIVSPLISEVLLGYNCTVFAYGQTSTGKTYTMEGKHDEDSDYSWDQDPKAGIIPRALHHIFSELNALSVDDFSVRVSYVELYNEELYDLLATGDVNDQNRLRIFDDKTHGGTGVLINGLTEIAVRNRDEVYNLLKRGAERRRTASTLMNKNSSRSHSVFTVTVLFRDNTAKTEELLLKTGKLHLVDLAGSESVGRSGAVENRAREAGSINQSLLTLGRVINALTTNAAHIPYRESKLTRILQDSLGGKTITTIIATLSPSSTNLEESLSTLDYAQRAKNIKNNPEINQQITRKALLREYNEEIEKLRKDLAAAREKNGIFMAQENYDQMQEQINENNAKIEEYEGQLMALTSKLQLMMNDLEYIGNQYELAYKKHLDAVKKLEKRVKELQKEKQEHARAKKELLATKKALEQSANKSTQLYAEAVQVNEANIVIGSELEAMFNKFEECKAIFEKNDQLFGQFSARRIHDSHQIKDKVADFARTSASSMDSLKRVCRSLEESVTQRMCSVNDDVQEMASDVSKFNEDTVEYLQSVSTFAKEHVENYVTKMEAKIDTIQNYCLEILKHSKNELQLVQEFSTVVNGHENKMKTILQSLKTEVSAQTAEQNAIINQVTQLMEKLKTSTTTIREASTTAVSEAQTEINQHCSKWKKVETEFTDDYGRISEVVIKKQEALENVMQRDKKFATEQLDMAIGLKDTLTSKSNDISKEVTEKASDIQATVDNTNEVCKHKTEAVISQLDSHANNVSNVTDDMTGHLHTSQKDMEHFIHQEIIRYSSSGDTPVRKKRQFGVELTQIPTASELLEQHYSALTPISACKVRESLLIGDNAAVMSPASLKEKLTVHKEIENDNSASVDESH